MKIFCGFSFRIYCQLQLQSVFGQFVNAMEFWFILDNTGFMANIQKSFQSRGRSVKKIMDDSKVFHIGKLNKNSICIELHLKIWNFLENAYIKQMKSQVSDNSVANFVQKAFQIITDIENSKVIHWSGNGKEFTIKDIEQFQEAVLPKYFRHRNINSFIRQLNMYGFHKSRKEPTKNIFSHPFFQKDRQDLLCQVRRKPKHDENETPKKSNYDERSEEKITIYDKPTAQKQELKFSSFTSIVFKSSLNLDKETPSPFKGLISKSFIMDINPEAALRLRSNSNLPAEEEDDSDDNLSIAEDINKERQRFNNRNQRFSIVRTSNFLEEFQF